LVSPFVVLQLSAHAGVTTESLRTTDTAAAATTIVSNAQTITRRDFHMANLPEDRILSQGDYYVEIATCSGLGIAYGRGCRCSGVRNEQGFGRDICLGRGQLQDKGRQDNLQVTGGRLNRRNTC